MQIITYVRVRVLTHKDSLGNEGRIEAGDVQVMSAGTGVRHAEYNLEQQQMRIFQMWITPSSAGGAPAWGAQPFPKADRSARLVTLASGFDNDDDALWRGDELRQTIRDALDPVEIPSPFSTTIWPALSKALWLEADNFKK